MERMANERAQSMQDVGLVHQIMDLQLMMAIIQKKGDIAQGMEYVPEGEKLLDNLKKSPSGKEFKHQIFLLQ